MRSITGSMDMKRVAISNVVVALEVTIKYSTNHRFYQTQWDSK